MLWLSIAGWVINLTVFLCCLSVVKLHNVQRMVAFQPVWLPHGFLGSKTNTLTLNGLSIFLYFQYCDELAHVFVCILKTMNGVGEITPCRLEEVVCFWCYYSCFCPPTGVGSFRASRANRTSAESAKVNGRQPSSSLVTTALEQITASAGKGPIWYCDDRFKTTNKVVFQRALLSESEGTLFASAPSRPDVLALKELGVACSSVSRTVFKSACSLPFSYSVEVTAQC